MTILLQFNYEGNFSGPFHNDVGTINYLPGWFDYTAVDPGGTISPGVSMWDPLYNQSHTFIGFVFVRDDGNLNGTDGFFQFRPEVFNPPSGIDQVYVTNLATYSNTAYSGGSPGAVPEASTWLMLAMGLALLLTKTTRAVKARI